MTNNQRFLIDLDSGEMYEDFIIEKLYKVGFPIVSFKSKKKNLEMENQNGIEIKYDKNMQKTRNLFIECYSRGNVNIEYKESGILKHTGLLYLIGDYSFSFVFLTNHLKTIVKKHIKDQSNLKEIGSKTSKGVLLPVDTCKNYSQLYIWKNIK